MLKKFITITTLITFFAFSDGFSGFFEGEKRVLVEDCLKFYEKGKLLNRYINRYFINEKVERSDEYYEISYRGGYYNLFLGYKIYEKNMKYIVNSECVTIDFDKANKEKEHESLKKNKSN